MRIQLSKFLALATLLALQQLRAAPQESKPKPEDTEIWEPVPKVVTPGAATSVATPPSDAIVLFDGKNLDEWVTNKDKSPAKWTIADGIMTVDKKSGNIE